MAKASMLVFELDIMPIKIFSPNFIKYGQQLLVLGSGHDESTIFV